MGTDKSNQIEGKSVYVNVTEQQEPSVTEVEQRDTLEEWQPGMTRNLPWVAVAELITALVCSMVAVIIVCVSDGVEQGAWSIRATRYTKQLPIEPKLILSAMSSIITLMLGLALKEGMCISWWRRALQGGRVKDLERHWSFGTSVVRAAFAGKYINLAAVALLFMTVTGLTESTVLQRATSIAALPVKNPSLFSISSQIATKLPYTGFMASGALIPEKLDPVFAQVVREFTDRSPINSSFSGCAGSCSATVVGAGVAIECDDSNFEQRIGEAFFNQSDPMSFTADGFAQYPDSWTDPWTVFQFNITGDFDTSVDAATVSQLNLTFLSSTATIDSEQNCPRTATVRNCRLRAAMVDYPVKLTGSTVALDKTKSPLNYTVRKDILLNDNNTDYQFTTLGGLWLYLDKYYTSSQELYWANKFGDGWAVRTNGSLVYSYEDLDEFNIKDSSYSCNTTYLDPMSDILSAVNELMFRSVIATSDSFDLQRIDAFPTGSINYYQSSYLFLGISVAIVVLNIALILPLIWGWWHLGRKVSFNPIDTAEAFNAPILRKDTGHADVQDLIKQVGDRRIVYRPVDQRVQVPEREEVTIVRRLAMAEPST